MIFAFTIGISVKFLLVTYTLLVVELLNDELKIELLSLFSLVPNKLLIFIISHLLYKS
nr:MAG TPA: hypothetical protein [Caudoviricetes sp.]